MSESVSLPALGESVTEGTITRWLKQVGDRIEVDEPLVEVSTDKVDTEIPSPVAGIVEAILVAEDETVDVGTVLATIGDGSATPVAAPAPSAVAEAVASSPAPAPEVVAPAVAPAVAPEAASPVSAAPTVAPPVSHEIPNPPVAAATAHPVAPAAPEAVEPVASQPAPSAPGGSSAPAAPATPPAPTQVATDSRSTYVTPIVRKLAAEHGVNLAEIAGTGVGGRIRKQDVLEATAATGSVRSAVTAHAPIVSPLRGTTVAMSRLRRVIAERAVASMQQTAQLTTVVEVDVTEVAALRESVKADFLAKTGVKLTFMPFFALAAAEALAQFPIINATVEGESIVYPATENISIAVDSERGLLSPVIRDTFGKSIKQLAIDIADVADRTRNNQLKPDELSGGTFTLTNTGSRGALFDTPVVFLPQSAILGTGIVTKRPVVTSSGGGDAIAIRSTVYLALSYDHRIIDGADAARFLTSVKARLEAGDFSADLGI